MENLSEVFADVTPIPQDDGPNPVCSIDYPNGFVEAMDYFRAILKMGEHSERALKLTLVCLRFNPANYTTWWFRRQCLASLSSSKTSPLAPKSDLSYFTPALIEKDLELASTLGGSNPKNYQVWYHRRSLLEQSFLENSKDADVLTLIEEELEYISFVLEEDSKNYHAWSHRQWILKATNIEENWNDEIDFVEELLLDDVRNNSAWNQAWFVSHRGSKSAPFSLAQAEREVAFAIEKANIDPYNESPWKYFIAIIKEQSRRIGISSEEFKTFLATCEKSVEDTKVSFERGTNKDGMECTHLISAYVDILEMNGSAACIEKALGFVEALEKRYDPIRKKYWKLRADNLHAS